VLHRRISSATDGAVSLQVAAKRTQTVANEISGAAFTFFLERNVSVFIFLPRCVVGVLCCVGRWRCAGRVSDFALAEKKKEKKSDTSTFCHAVVVVLRCAMRFK
jgi:hypothetical protein